MPLFVTTRRVLASVPAVLLAVVLCLPASAQFHSAAQKNNNSHAAAPPPHPGFTGNPGKNLHLQQWMDRHSNLTPEQQQKALEREPGFRDLPPETQQRMRNHLNQLNSMPPEKRQRWLERNEAMARLTLPQREQVRDTMKQYRELPPDRKRQVARAFRDLHDVPEEQRQALLNSDRYRSQFSDQELGTLSGLLSVEGYHVIQPNRPENAPQR
jgi:hypothetical protein